MTQTIKEVNGREGTRSSYPDISNQFKQIANWNIYERGNTVTNDEGTKYKHMGIINGVILLQKLA